MIRWAGWSSQVSTQLIVCVPKWPIQFCRNLCWIPCWSPDKQNEHCSVLRHWKSHLLREDKLIRYNLLLINLVSYLILHLIDNGVQGPELNLNFGLFFCRPSFLNMGRKFVIFHLTGDSPSCYDLSEEVESSLVMVLTDSFAPLRWIPWGCLRWSSLCPRGQQQKRHKVSIFRPQVSCFTKTVCPHLLSLVAGLFIETFDLVFHTLYLRPEPEYTHILVCVHVCVCILVF